MLTCRTVLEALPGIEAGEPASGAVRDHLSNCEACRAEASCLRGDLETLRQDLAALAPSPFLEDAVFEAVRGAAPVPGARRSPGLKTAAAVAVAAAALLVGVLIVDRSGPGESTPPSAAKDDVTDAGGPGQVEMPPSAGTVQAARVANAEPLVKLGGDRTGILIHRDRDREGRYRMHLGDRFAPPADGAPHRWVEQADDPEAQQNFYEMAGAPTRGVMILGLGILERLAPRGERGQGEWLAAALARLLPSKADSYVDVTVQAPYPGAPKAQVRVLVSDRYSGSLLLEEPLARALGLHHFEKRGGCTIGGNLSLAGRRATARVRIAGVAFDEILEVQVLKAASPTPAEQRDGDDPVPALSIELRGERPHAAFIADQISTKAGSDVVRGIEMTDPVQYTTKNKGGLARLSLKGTGPRQALLSYEAETYPQCFVFLPPLDVGGGGPAALRFDMQRVTVPGSFEPGAEVMISRVWRGRIAIPSRESVASTQVAKDGSISFVHVRGEVGDLRMRLRTKDNIIKWVDVYLDEDPPPGIGRRIRLQVDAAGSVLFGGQTWRILKDTQDMRADPDVIGQLQQVIKDLAQEPHSPPSSTWEAAIEADRDTPWRCVQWLMQALAAPDIQISQLRFSVTGLPGRTVRNVLPRDGGLEQDDETGLMEETIEPPSKPGPGTGKSWRTFRVIFMLKNAQVRYRTRGSIERIEGMIGQAPADERRLREAADRAAFAAHKAGAPLIMGELSTPPPLGTHVPYYALFRAMELLRQAGIQRVIFEGYPW